MSYTGKETKDIMIADVENDDIRRKFIACK